MYFEEMTEEQILEEALKAVPEYLQNIRQTGKFDLDRCVDLELKRIEQIYRQNRKKPLNPRQSHEDRQALGILRAHYRKPLTLRTIPIRQRYIQGRKVSEINAISAKAIITARMKEDGFDATVIGQRYRARVEVPIGKRNQVRFYVPYKDMNRDGLLDEHINTIRRLQEALEKLGPGAVVEKM